MWNSANIDIEMAVVPMGTFLKTAEWLSANHENNKISYVPSTEVFLVLNPELEKNLMQYETIWESTGVILQANTTNAEVNEVRDHLRNIIRNDPKVQYLVFDWVDPYAKKLIGDAMVCKNLDDSLREIKRFAFKQPHSDWHSSILICEVYRGDR